MALLALYQAAVDLRRPDTPAGLFEALVSIAPFGVWVTLNRASVVSGSEATWSAMPGSSISQYGMNPYSS